MKTTERLDRIAQLLPSLRKKLDEKEWSEANTIAAHIKAHLDVIRDVASELAEMAPKAAPVTPLAQPKPPRRPRRDKGTRRDAPMTASILAKLSNMVPGETRLITSDGFDGYRYQACIGGTLNKLWGNQSYRTTLDKTTGEILVVRLK